MSKIFQEEFGFDPLKDPVKCDSCRRATFLYHIRDGQHWCKYCCLEWKPTEVKPE